MRFSKHCNLDQKRTHKHHHKRNHKHSILRKRLFWQIYVVVVGSVVFMSFLAGMLVRMRAEGAHVPIFPLLAIAALVVSILAYPVSRRLTRRLEGLKRGVDALGEGHLDTRVEAVGCDEVAMLATSFNRSAERIQALVLSHRQLLANASHELRSPLARMQMSVALLSEQPKDSTPQLAALRQDIRELDQLVEEILLASRLDTLEIPLTQHVVDLAGLLAEECARCDCDCEAQALQTLGDARLLRRLIRNLLENAKRYGGGEVQARLKILSPQQLSLQILDRGQGIDPAARERIFEPFYRPAGHGEGQGGWGLGLSLVKQIATRHGGSVTCQARDGGGTVFEVVLPLYDS